MSREFWFCPNCGHQNQPAFRHCPQCGRAYPNEHVYVPPVGPKKNTALKIGVLGCLGLIGLVVVIIIFGVVSRKPSDTRAIREFPPLQPKVPPTSDGKSPGLARLEQMPDFSGVAEAGRKIGFKVDSFGTGQTSADSLTGRAFMVTAKQIINGQNFNLVIMGPASDRVDTVRFQAWGIQTAAARKILQKQAETVLAGIKRGTLPPDFLKRFYAGEQVGDDGVTNGFCNVQVLQRPTNPGSPSTQDRISLDLIFDTTDK